MRTRTVIIALTAGVLGIVAIIIGFSDRADQATVDELARRQRDADADVTLDATSERFQPEMFQLTERLIAEKEESRNSWFLKGSDPLSFVELPFPPSMDGQLPAAHPGGSSAANTTPSNPAGFLGSAACAACHQEKHSGFIATAHHQTSGLVTPEMIHGQFTEPRNKLRTRDRDLAFTMTRRDGRFVQQVSFADWKLEFPLDVFTGSAKTGQTLLYWNDDALYQAFVSYLTAPDEWIPSPGYRDTQVHYARRIRPACLECHITYIDLKRKPNVYDPQSAVWGISCERCHGPGRQHVKFHQEHPQEKTAKHIIHPSDLPRDRQLDICGQCHSGSFGLKGDPFTYRPGDELDKFHELLNPGFGGVGGIHTSNQLTRLRMSKCFQESEMTCTSCHNPHQNQRGKTAVFTQSCLGCHEPTHCGMSEQLGDKISDNCVSCHMPVGDTEGMKLEVAGGTFTVKMLDHHIRVDEKSSEAYLSKQAIKGN